MSSVVPQKASFPPHFEPFGKSSPPPPFFGFFSSFRPPLQKFQPVEKLSKLHLLFLLIFHTYASILGCFTVVSFAIL